MIDTEENHTIVDSSTTNSQNKWLTWFPVIGILSYAVFFFIAKGKYAGGLEEYHLDKNLMCDMMDKITSGGFENKGRLMAVIGHTFLFIGMTTFFYILPLIFKKRNLNTRLFQGLGMTAMFLFMFLSTDHHDILVLIAGTLSALSAIPLIYEYVQLGSSSHKIFAIICLFLSFLVFIGYQFKIGSEYLPAFQKIVFVFDAVWVFLVCRQIRTQLA